MTDDNSSEPSPQAVPSTLDDGQTSKASTSHPALPLKSDVDSERINTKEEETDAEGVSGTVNPTTGPEVHSSASALHNARPLPSQDDFPPCPDKGDNAPIWRTYVEETDKYDRRMIQGWNEGIDVLLIFTGLFSAILSAFLISSWTLLQPDNVQATVNGIATLSQQLANMSIGHGLDPSLAYYQQSSFTPPFSALAVNGLWFTALILSLAAAVTGMLVKGNG